MNFIIQPIVCSYDTESILDWLEGFLDNYRALKTGDMDFQDNDKYNLLGFPGFFQCFAFSRFFQFFEREEYMVEEIK